MSKIKKSLNSVLDLLYSKEYDGENSYELVLDILYDALTHVNLSTFIVDEVKDIIADVEDGVDKEDIISCIELVVSELP